MRIGKTFRFEAAHQLPNHRGKCARPHGHSYVVEVVLRGAVNETPGDSDEGMVIDFSELSQAMKAYVIDPLDHQDLNRVLVDPGELPVTTAENIARWIMGELSGVEWSRDVVVESVKVWETATSWASVSVDSPGDFLL